MGFEARSPVPKPSFYSPTVVAGAVVKLMAQPEGTLRTSGKEAVLGFTYLHELNSFKRVIETVSSKAQHHTEREILKSE